MNGEGMVKGGKAVTKQKAVEEKEDAGKIG